MIVSPRAERGCCAVATPTPWSCRWAGCSTIAAIPFRGCSRRRPFPLWSLPVLAALLPTIATTPSGEGVVWLLAALLGFQRFVADLGVGFAEVLGPCAPRVVGPADRSRRRSRGTDRQDAGNRRRRYRDEDLLGGVHGGDDAAQI